MPSFPQLLPRRALVKMLMVVMVALAPVAGRAADNKAADRGAAGSKTVAEGIAPHRAVYQLTLARALPMSGVIGVEGSMEFRWADVCRGWAVEQRHQMTIQYQEQDDSSLSGSLASWEAKDGSSYRFSIRNKREAGEDEAMRGEAFAPLSGEAKDGEARDGDSKAGTVRFFKPENQAGLRLDAGTLFPTAHTILLIEAARRGEDFLARAVFSGESPDGSSWISGAFGRGNPGDSQAENALLRARYWPVSLAFFPVGEATSPGPDYELSALLQENGVVRDIMMDYGKFTVHGRLTEVTPLPRSGC